VSSSEYGFARVRVVGAEGEIGRATSGGHPLVTSRAR
jgi:hypothetical protein